MKTLQTFLILITVFISTLSFAHGGKEHSHQSREQVAWTKISQGALVIDVRTTKEYSGQSLTNALHIPYQDIVKQFKALEIRKDRHVVFYCHSGNRAGKAIISLRKAGYSNLHNGGGIQDLLDAKK